MIIIVICVDECVPQGHSSFVTHVDWSSDSRYLVTNSGDYEILFCEWSLPLPVCMCICAHITTH